MPRLWLQAVTGRVVIPGPDQQRLVGSREQTLLVSMDTLLSGESNAQGAHQEQRLCFTNLALAQINLPVYVCKYSNGQRICLVSLTPTSPHGAGTPKLPSTHLLQRAVQAHRYHQLSGAQRSVSSPTAPLVCENGSM